MASDFTELRIWQRASELATKIYNLTKGFPKEELYGLTSQLRRAAISVPANIAEGYGRRNKQEIIQFVLISRGSLAEVRSHIAVAKNLGFLPLHDANEIDQEYQGLAKGINVFLKSFRNSKPI
ncbi:MAG: four helix bundle protein [Patescibacteria group bacterium]